jgi:hypothetical protein
MSATLEEVTFCKGWDVYQDKDRNNVKYPEPHWTRDCGKSLDPDVLQPCPYLYGVEKNKLTVKKAVWSFHGSMDASMLKIIGVCSDGQQISTGTITVEGKRIVLTNATVRDGDVFEAKTKFFNPYGIKWMLSFDGGKNYEESGTSQNPIYVCLQGPECVPDPVKAPEKVVAYRTVVHLACSNDGATTPNEAVEKTWEIFANLDVKGWDRETKAFDRKLHYYKPDSKFEENAVFYTFNLLQNTKRNPFTKVDVPCEKEDTGQCMTWARLLRDAGKLNGGNLQLTLAKPKDPFPGTSIIVASFLVKDWEISPGADPPIFEFAGMEKDMVPVPNKSPTYEYGKYGDFINKKSLEGQNSKPPSQKYFGNHVFVRFQKSQGATEYLDPSYGVKYAGENEFAAAFDFQKNAIEIFGITLSDPHGEPESVLVPPPADECWIEFIFH